MYVHILRFAGSMNIRFKLQLSRHLRYGFIIINNKNRTHPRKDKLKQTTPFDQRMIINRL